MEFLSGLIAFIIVSIPITLLIYICWLFFGPTGKQANISTGPRQPSYYSDDDDEDGDWEGQIRHDPFHPGGSPGADHGGGGRW